MINTPNPGGNTGLPGNEILIGLRRYLRGEGEGTALITIEEWLVGFVAYGILGKYPLHIYTFLPQTPDPDEMPLDVRRETALMIVEAFFLEKLPPPEFRKIAKVATSDNALRNYLYTAVRNWTTDLIRKFAQTDDALHLGLQIEKLLKRYPDTFVELAHADNWRESMWRLAGKKSARQSAPNSADIFKLRARGVARADSADSHATVYRRRLVSMAALSKLLRDIMKCCDEPMSIFEIWSVCKEKVSLGSAGRRVISIDNPFSDGKTTLSDTIRDDRGFQDGDLIDKYDLPVCASEFLSNLDDLDMKILRAVLSAAFSGRERSPKALAADIMADLSIPTSTFYFRRDRLKKRIADILSEQDETLFYHELQTQLESAKNDTFVVANMTGERK